ncbi:class I SAM-dependent methyltransferase [Candidatus Gottesmanbacteria bacterium]|nr:class I SAM-dependent methyltransferase [Candidatus Gottesmanbacteria bacterium]
MFRLLFKRIVDFIKQYKKDGTFVDIGAGVGLLVDEARRAGFDASGIEPSLSAVRAARKFFHIQLLHTKFTEKSMKKPVDIVVLNHVLEHLPNPHAVIRTIANVLEKDGLLVIGVPNFGSIMSLLKKSRWQSLVLDQHRWHFTQKNT